MTDAYHLTPLHYAVKYQHVDIIRILLRHGAGEFCRLFHFQGKYDAKCNTNQVYLLLVEQNELAIEVLSFLFRYCFKSFSYQYSPKGQFQTYRVVIHSFLRFSNQVFYFVVSLWLCIQNSQAKWI